MRKFGLEEKYVRVVQDMYDDSMTAVRCAVGMMEWVQGGCGIASRVGSEPFLAYNVDRLVDK